LPPEELINFFGCTLKAAQFGWAFQVKPSTD